MGRRLGRTGAGLVPVCWSNFMWRGEAAAWSLAWHGGVLKVTAAWKETGACSAMQRRQSGGDVGMWPGRCRTWTAGSTCLRCRASGRCACSAAGSSFGQLVRTGQSTRPTSHAQAGSGMAAGSMLWATFEGLKKWAPFRLAVQLGLQKKNGPKLGQDWAVTWAWALSPTTTKKKDKNKVR